MKEGNAGLHESFVGHTELVSNIEEPASALNASAACVQQPILCVHEHESVRRLDQKVGVVPNWTSCIHTLLRITPQFEPRRLQVAQGPKVTVNSMACTAPLWATSKCMQKAQKVP